MEILDIILVFIVGVVGGSFGTLVGCASLITIPALIFTGLPSPIAIATNRFGHIGLNASGWFEFSVKKLVNYKLGFLLAIPAIAGSVIGAKIVLNVDTVILDRIIGIVTIVILAFVMLGSHTGEKKKKKKIPLYKYKIGIVISFILGIYGGFYGAGVGTFYSYILILLFGQTFLESAGTRKIAQFFLSIFATIIFLIEGAVVIPLAVSLFVGTSIGSYIGSYYSDHIGNKWIKRIFIIAVLILSLKLLI